MDEFLGDRRRLFFTAVIISFFAAFSGALTVLIAGQVFDLRGEDLVLWTTVVCAAGGVLGQVFGAPLLAASLEGAVIPAPPPPPGPDELEKWLASLRREVTHLRDQQREQMLRGNTIMTQLVTPNLELRTGRSGRPMVRLGAAPEGPADLTHAWKESKGRLVVLGKPGYGKTFAALTLIHRINQEGKQVADLLSLAEWYVWSVGQKEPTIEDWLIDELCRTYPDYASAILPLVREGRLVPVFDGLDEVPALARVECRNALEAYAGRESPHRPFVLTCREEEYLNLAPKWVGADRQVALKGLSAEEIVAVLSADTSLSGPWEEVIASLEAGNQDLLALLRSPLHLGAVLEIYESRNPVELLQLAKRRHAQEELWDLLLGIETHTFEGHDQEEVRGWLKFIGASLRSHQRQRFWLHELYLYADPGDRYWFFRLGLAAAITPLVIQAAFLPNILPWLLTGAIGTGLYIAYRRRRDKPLQIAVKHRTHLRNYLKALPESLLVGLMVALLWGIVVFPTICILDLAAQAIDGIPLDLSWAIGLGVNLLAVSAIPMVVIGTALRLDAEGTLSVAEEPPKHLLGRGPGAVLRSALLHGLLAVGIGGSLLLLVRFLLEHQFHMSVGLAVTIFLFAWLSGLEAWAYYHWTRWSLARKKLLPLRLRAFLDWAAQDTGILRASDSYEFRHRELLEYLARGVYPVGAVNVSWEESRRATDPATGSGQVAHPAQAKTTSRREEEEERLRRRIADRQAAVDQDGTDPKARSELANVFHQAGNPLAALEHIRRATLLEPDNARHLADYAQILDSLGKGNEALDLLSSATHPSPQDGAHLRSLRAAVVKNQRSREARIELAAGRTHAKPDDPWAWWNLSVAWRMAGDPSRAAEARRRCVALADDLDAQEIGRLAWRLNSRGYSKDAVAVAQSLPGKDRRRQAQILGHAYGDLNEFIQADRCLREVEESAVSAEILNALANLLITRGRWADAATAAEQAQSKEPAELAFDFTLAEARLASGDLDSARAALAFALDKARRDESRSAGDPAWLCRILWQYNAFPRPGQAIEMVIEEFHARGLDHALAEGLITATPISQDQSGWSPSRLPEWCFHWGRHRQLRAAVGIVQRLADEAAAGSRVPA